MHRAITPREGAVLCTGRSRRVKVRCYVPLALAVLAGCPATGVYRSADPVAPGEWRVGGAASIGVYRDEPQDTRIPTGTIELVVRRGIVEDLDVGARLSTAGLDVSATWRFSHRRWSWAVAPSIGGLRASESGLSPVALHLFGQAAVIGSRPLSSRWTLGVGPTLGAGLYWPETGGHATGVWLGGFVNAGARVGKWIFAPELGVLRVVSGDVPVDGSGLHLGVGVTRDL
jgi:hypothetical protein